MATLTREQTLLHDYLSGQQLSTSSLLTPQEPKQGGVILVIACLILAILGSLAFTSFYIHATHQP